MRHKGTSFYFLTFILLLLAFNSPAQAQDDLPAVQIDMSVLGAANPALGASQKQKNRQQEYSPFLTKSRNAGTISKPVAEIPYEREVRTPVAKEPATDRFVHFPVQVKNRNDDYDPGLNQSAPFDPDNIERIQEVSVTEQPPIPAYKPIETASKPTYTKTTARKIPVPPRQPAVKLARVNAKPLEKTVKALPQKLEIKGDKSGIKMPAVPAEVVDAETLKPSMQVAATDADIRGYALVTPDRMDMVKQVEKVTALAEALATKQPATTKIRPEKAMKAAFKAPVPSKKPIVSDTIIANIEEAIQLSEIEPAAGEMKLASLSTPAMKDYKPRAPDTQFEEEYITVPFTKGKTELDAGTFSSLDSDVIDLLKDNPEWRLQIQAFASKTDNKVGNARRISLSRALAIRSYLMDNGIEARRMDVRALGMQTDRSPVDRVDFVIFDPNMTN